MAVNISHFGNFDALALIDVMEMAGKRAKNLVVQDLKNISHEH